MQGARIVGKKKPSAKAFNSLCSLIRPFVRSTSLKKRWKDATIEFARALYSLCAYNGNPIECYLPPKLNHCWQQLILETKIWRNVQKRLRKTLEHTQENVSHKFGSRNYRVGRTVTVYKTLFDEEPDKDLWERERANQIFIKMPDNTMLTMPINPKTTFGDIFRFIEPTGWSSDAYKLHSGCRYYRMPSCDSRTLEEGGIDGDAMFHVLGGLKSYE